MNYYDGTKLLSLKDINGEKPELYLVTSNRSAGKTTYFGRLMINRFIKKGKKFMLLYRFKDEINEDISDKFFKDIGALFFPEYVMTEKLRGKYYKELFLARGDDMPISCGYAVPLNSADRVKKDSHLFSDVDSMLFDEFQSETEHYCPNEIDKFISVHTSVARGAGQMVRYVPVYMLSNGVTILNPYYTALGIQKRLTGKTHYLKGDGWILEQNFNVDAADSQKTSAFNKAFKESRYTAYARENVYLNDNTAFIGKMKGKNTYVCTIKYAGKYYGIKEYPEQNIIYCDDSPDMTFNYVYVVNPDDHNADTTLLHRNEQILYIFKDYFKKGLFRFKNAECKNAVLSMLSV